MRQYYVGSTVLLSLALLVSPAWAVSLTLSPTNQAIAPTGTASVDLGISGLGNGIAPPLKEFDISLQFDSGVVNFTSVSFGASLGVQDTDFAVFNKTSSETDIAVDSSVANSVSLFEISFLSPTVLNALQADSFTLATLTFTGLAPGTSALNFGNVSLLNANGDSLTATTQNAAITVAGTNAVPEPSTIMLLGAGLIGLALWRWGAREKELVG